MDLDGWIEILGRLERGELRTVAIDTPEPSAFCHEIFNANPYAYLDDAPLEERRARAVTLRRTIRTTIDGSDGAGVLDPAAIAEVIAESWPVVRDADELHDALSTLARAAARRQWGAGSQNSSPTSEPPLEGEFRTCAERLDAGARGLRRGG